MNVIEIHFGPIIFKSDDYKTIPYPSQYLVDGCGKSFGRMYRKTDISAANLTLRIRGVGVMV